VSDFNKTEIFSTDLKKTQISLSVQLEPICSMRTGSQTDMTKLIVPFRNFAKDLERGRHGDVSHRKISSCRDQSDVR